MEGKIRSSTNYRLRLSHCYYKLDNIGSLVSEGLYADKAVDFTKIDAISNMGVAVKHQLYAESTDWAALKPRLSTGNLVQHQSQTVSDTRGTLR
jgi:hypothetical protein